MCGVSDGQDPAVRKLQVRLPPGLHEQLVEEAHSQGISLNALIVALLAGGIGWKLTDT
jgi:predicted HicB family RNase H-like nuclease